MKIEIDKPVIPQFVAEWLEECKGWNDYEQEYDGDNAIDLFSAMDLDNAGMQDNVQDYLVDNTETFARAWLYGFTVEEEQKYNVKFKVKSSFGTVGIFLYKEGDEVLAGNNFKVYYPKEDVYRLTEQEIRDFQNGDILFEHFAVKVEEV